MFEGKPYSEREAKIVAEEFRVIAEQLRNGPAIISASDYAASFDATADVLENYDEYLGVVTTDL